jgi:hypothetical protein
VCQLLLDGDLCRQIHDPHVEAAHSPPPAVGNELLEVAAGTDGAEDVERTDRVINRW